MFETFVFTVPKCSASLVIVQPFCRSSRISRTCSSVSFAAPHCSPRALRSGEGCILTGSYRSGCSLRPDPKTYLSPVRHVVIDFSLAEESER